MKHVGLQLEAKSPQIPPPQKTPTSLSELVPTTGLSAWCLSEISLKLRFSAHTFADLMGSALRRDFLASCCVLYLENIVTAVWVTAVATCPHHLIPDVWYAAKQKLTVSTASQLYL